MRNDAPNLTAPRDAAPLQVAVYGSGFEGALSTGDADPDGVTDAAPVAGVTETDPVGVGEADGFATGAGFCWAESLSAKLPASRDAIPAAMLSGNLCTMLS